jgi:hypothetical protein
VAGLYTARERQGAGSQVQRGFFRTPFLLGVAAGKTLQLIRYPYAAISRVFSGLDNGSSRPASTESRTRKIFSRLSNINTRLSSIEQSVSKRGTPREAVRTANKKKLLKDAAGRERGDGLSDSLMEAISDPDPGVREIALKTLGEISGEESVVLILESLHDPDPRVRAAAAAASPTSIFSLILLLHDREIEVRQQAKSAIEAITGKTVDFDPSDPSQARRKKVESLQNWWKDERFAKLSGELKIALKEWKNK